MSIKHLAGYISIFLLVSAPYACEDMDRVFVDCENCFVYEPTYADVLVKFTINKEYPSVVYSIYDGTIDEGKVILTDTTFDSEMYWSLDVGYYYSVVAEYSDGGRTINVVDGKKLRAQLDKSSCDQECYIVVGDELDARLKY